MAKVIRLTENDVEKLVKKIIKEDTLKEAKQRRVRPRFDAVEFFHSMAGIDELLESAMEGEDLGDSGGIFTEEEFTNWIFGHSGDRDYDDDLGNHGWYDIEDNLDRLAQLYLNDLGTTDYSNYFSEDELFNVENSLKEIIGGDGEGNSGRNNEPEGPIEPKPKKVYTRPTPIKIQKIKGIVGGPKNN